MDVADRHVGSVTAQEANDLGIRVPGEQAHQLGTATATFNFFRSLGSAILVAVFGTLFLGGLGVGGQAIGSLQNLVAMAARNGTPMGPVFTLIFGAASVTLVLGLACFQAMEERPLKGRAGA